MRYEYTHLIPENVAPAGATCIVVLDSQSTDIGSISLGGLSPPTGTLILRLCVVADPHIGTSETNAGFGNVLDYVDGDKECRFTVVCGDLVNNGSDETQRNAYRSLVCAAKKPVYSIAGNHDAIWGYPTDEFLMSYTGSSDNSVNPGCPFFYAVAHASDEANRIYGNASVPEGLLLIFLGYNGKDHSGGNGDWRGGEQFSADELAWFESVMSAHKDKRRMVFMHPYIPDTAGDPPLTITPPNEPPDLWTKKSTVSTDAGADFLRMLDQYPGALVVNGHSHYRFRTQEEQSTAIVYNPPSGNYTIVHTPSPTKLRDVRNGQRKDLTASDADYGGEGYIVDVYPDSIHFRGRDFVNHVWVGIGTYLIRR